MPKITLSFDFDLDGAKKGAKEVGGAIEDALGKASGGNQQGGIQKITSMFRDIAEQLESMTEMADKFNKTWKEGLQVDRDRLKAIKDLGREQQAMSTKESQARSQAQAQGGNLGASTGWGARRRGKGTTGPGFWMGQGGSQIMSLGGDMLTGQGATSDWMGYGARGMQIAGAGLAFKGMFRAAGALGLGAEAVQYGAKVQRREEMQGQELGLAYSTGGRHAYAAARRAALAETGQGGWGARTAGRMGVLAASPFSSELEAGDALSSGSKDKGFGLWKYGIDAPTYFRMTGALSRAGGREMVTDRRQMSNVSALHRLYGADNEAIGMVSAMSRGGAFSSESSEGLTRRNQAMAEVMGAAIASELDEGRFGEAFDVIRSAYAETGARGVLNFRDTAGMMLAMSQLGDRYRGDTASSRSMHGMALSIGRGQAGGGFGRVMGLQAAGLGKGSSYLQAVRGMKLAGTEGGTSKAASISMLREYADMMGDGLSVADKATILSEEVFPNLPLRQIMDALAKDELGQYKMKVPSGVSWFDMIKAGNKALRENPVGSIVRLAREKIDELNQFGSSSVTAVKDKGPTELARMEMGLDPASKRERKAARMEAAAEERLESTRAAAIRRADARVQATETQSMQSRNQAVAEQFDVGGSGSFGDIRHSAPTGPHGEYHKSGPRGHKGIDLYFDPDRAVRAPASGTVTVARETMRKKKLGGIVVIEGEDGMFYRLLHLKGIKVKRSQKVAKGDIVADGLAKLQRSKQHVHAEVRKGAAWGKGSTALDPMKHMDLGAISGIQNTSDIAAAAANAPSSQGEPTMQMEPMMVGKQSGGSGPVVVQSHVTVIQDENGMVRAQAKAHHVVANSAPPGDAVAMNSDWLE